MRAYKLSFCFLFWQIGPGGSSSWRSFRVTEVEWVFVIQQNESVREQLPPPLPQPCFHRPLLSPAAGPLFFYTKCTTKSRAAQGEVKIPQSKRTNNFQVAWSVWSSSDEQKPPHEQDKDKYRPITIMNKSEGLSSFGLENKFTEKFIPPKHFLSNCFRLICSPRPGWRRCKNSKSRGKNAAGTFERMTIKGLWGSQVLMRRMKSGPRRLQTGTISTTKRGKTMKINKIFFPVFKYSDKKRFKKIRKQVI